MSRLRGFWPRPLIEPRGGMDWSPADFSEDALQYLLAEARQRVQEQLMFMDSQDVRTRTAFSISVLLVAAVGIIGDVSIDTRPLALLTVVAFSSSVVTWVCSWVAYRSVDVGSGVNVVRRWLAPSAAPHGAKWRMRRCWRWWKTSSAIRR